MYYKYATRELDQRSGTDDDHSPEGWFFYTKNQRVGETFKAQGVVPLYDFGLPAPVQQTKEQAKDESVNDSTRG